MVFHRIFSTEQRRLTLWSPSLHVVPGSEDLAYFLEMMRRTVQCGLSVLHYLCWGLYRSPDHIGLHNHETTAPSLPPPPLTNMANALIGTRPYGNINVFSALYSCQENRMNEEVDKSTKRLQDRQPSGDLVQLLKRVTCDDSPSMYAVDATSLRRGHLFQGSFWKTRRSTCVCTCSQPL